MENYQFIKQIGQGNFSEVWLVNCSKSRKKYVLKRIDLQTFPKREQRAAHLEAKLLSTVKHPYIVNYLDSFYNSRGSLFLVMCYCECGDLYTYLRSQNGVHFEEKQIVYWFVQICMALKYLHDKKILHRDLKTKNIFLTKSKLVKIGNFGLSKVVTTSSKMDNILHRAPSYTSPEIFSGQGYNEKSDVWALGCCVYEISALKDAFDVHCMQNWKKVIKRKLTLIAEIYSTQLSEIISSMLKYEQEKRPSVTELLLNEYIRKNIVLFLQDTPRSSSVISNTSKSGSTSSQDVRYGYHLLPDINKETSIIEKDNVQTQEMESIIKIPDVNGNGDGNDNSQHRANLSPLTTDSNFSVIDENSSDCSSREDHKLVICRCSSKRYMNSGIEKHNVSHQTSSVSKSAEKICAKRKSDFSFYILNNLSYSIRNIKLLNWEMYPNVSNNLTTKAKYFCGVTPPKSAEEFLSHSLSTNYETECLSTINAHKCLKGFANKSEENAPALPHIFNKLDTLPYKSQGNKLELPFLYDLKLSHAEDNSEKEDMKDSRVDNLLLNKIMESEKHHSAPTVLFGHQNISRLNIEHSLMSAENESLPE